MEAARRGALRGSAVLGVRKAGLALALAIFFSGAFYLYQVNDLANKGYEMKEVENKIAQLRQANERSKIQEVELRSMYNIEKSTGKFNLKNSSHISYLELNGPVAMK
jgi:hypothetical protein